MGQAYSKRKPNALGEFLLDVTPSLAGDGFFIYDITPYLSSKNGLDRKRMLAKANHTITGKRFKIYIIDHERRLAYEQAKRLAIHWYTNADNDYRLD